MGRRIRRIGGSGRDSIGMGVSTHGNAFRIAFLLYLDVDAGLVSSRTPTDRPNHGG